MHGATLKSVDAKQARLHNSFKELTSITPTDKNTKHAQMTYKCGHILHNNTNSTNANQREE
jgi:hypothetical protein